MTEFEYLDIAQLALSPIIKPCEHLRAAYSDCFRCLTRKLRMKIHTVALNDASNTRSSDSNLNGFYEI